MPSVRTLGPSRRIRVVAPSSPFSKDKLDRGVRRLEDAGWHFQDNDPLLDGEHPYLNGTDEKRAAALEDALASDDDVVWCARGGYGLTRLIGSIEFPAGQLPAVVGFSDVTALSALLFNKGFKSVHGPLATTVGDEPDESFEHLIAILEGRARGRALSGLRVMANPSPLKAKLFAANLCVLTHLIGTEAMPDLRDTLVVIEEVGERPYRIDRQLTHLMTTGAFDGVAGIVIGQLLDCDEPVEAGEPPITGIDVVRERLGGLGVPLLSGAPIGHGRPNFAVINGGLVEIELGDGDDDARLVLREELSEG
jgi:muramoyltetrapeptide carboxypeptidase